MCKRENKEKLTNAAFKSLEQKHKMLNKSNNNNDKVNCMHIVGSNRKTCKRKPTKN